MECHLYLWVITIGAFLVIMIMLLDLNPKTWPQATATF